MASTTFIDNQTIIYASWLNDVNNLTYNGQLISSILNSSTLALQTGGINAVTIDSSQNVTINKLVVSGSITAPGGLAVTGNSTVSGNLTVSGTATSNKYVANYGIYENKQAITANYSINSGNSAMSSGPITVNSGVTVTVPSGSRWVVL
jgi:cytoskeletal protein CcmA (bactofilin family)